MRRLLNYCNPVVTSELSCEIAEEQAELSHGGWLVRMLLSKILTWLAVEKVA